MLNIFKIMGQYTMQFLASIGLYEAFQKYLDSPESPDEHAIEVERRFIWTKLGIVLSLLTYFTIKHFKKKKR